MAFARNNNIDVAFPVSGGYLIVDSMRCLRMSELHDGVRNDPLRGNKPGLARIQIVGDSFQHFPMT